MTRLSRRSHPLVLGLLFGILSHSAIGVEGVIPPAGGCGFEKLKAEQLLDALKDKHAKNSRLYRRYLDKGGLLRSTPFQWALAEAARQNLGNGKSLVEFYDWKVSKAPDKLAEMAWLETVKHYDLAFMSDREMTEAEGQKDAAELAGRARRTGESQADFLTKAKEVAEINADPAKRAELVEYIAANLPDYGKAAIRYEVARRKRADLLLDLKAPLTLGLAGGSTFGMGMAAGFMHQNPVLGALIGGGAYGATKLIGFGSSVKTWASGYFKDRQSTKALKANLTDVDVEAVAVQHGIDVGAYRDMIDGKATKQYEPYKPLATAAPILEIRPITVRPDTLARELGETADYYADYGASVAGISMPLRTEIIRRSQEIMDPQRLTRLEKALEPVRRKLSSGETVSQADLQGMLGGSLTLRVDELKQQMRDLTKMEHDVRQVRDTAKLAHEAASREAVRIFGGLDELDKANTPNMVDRFEDFGRIDAEVKNLEATAQNLEGATVSIGGARAMVEAELGAMQTLQQTIAINPGGESDLIGETAIDGLEHLNQIIANRKGYEAKRAVKSKPVAQVEAPVEAPKVAEAEAPVAAAPAAPAKGIAKPKFR